MFWLFFLFLILKERADELSISVTPNQPKWCHHVWWTLKSASSCGLICSFVISICSGHFCHSSTSEMSALHRLLISSQLRCPPTRPFRCLLWGQASVWTLCDKVQTGVALHLWLTFGNFLPSACRISGAQPDWPSGSWSRLLSGPLFPVWSLCFDCQLLEESGCFQSFELLSSPHMWLGTELQGRVLVTSWFGLDDSVQILILS